MNARQHRPQRRYPQRRHPQREGGIALIAVLVVLSILLTLSAQFLLSMGHGDTVARAAVDERNVDWASASVRDWLLGKAGESAWAYDIDPLVDARGEYPDHVEFPEEFAAIADRDRVHFGGEVWDLQRKIDLNSATPLVFANLLGLAARTADDLAPDFDEITVESAEAFPAADAYLVLNGELIRYAQRDGATFRGLTRRSGVEVGFRAPADYDVPAGTLILDARVVMAAALSFFGDLDATTRSPLRSIADLGRLGALGFGAFSAEQFDVLDEFCTVGSLRENSTTWGKPERVFDIMLDELERPRTLRVRSAADMGGGSLVRIRSLDGTRSEYGMVWSTFVPQGQRGSIELAADWYVTLLTPLVHEYAPIETVVERLVPVPVNINTASEEVIRAIVEHARVRPRTIVAGGHRESGAEKPYLTRARADQLVQRVIGLREPRPEYAAELGPDAGEVRAFTGWEDFERRVYKQLLEESTGDTKRLWMLTYDLLQVGSSGGADMGTLPIAFHSGSVVGYRAAALRSEPLRGAESARLERQGIAVAVPNGRHVFGAGTQAQFEELFRLDRRFPQWLTYPINTSAILPTDRGTDPSIRTLSQTVAHAYPDAGFGQARFPDRDGEDGAFKPAPSVAPFAGLQTSAHDSFALAWHPEGRDLGQEGSYEIDNSGPRGPANAAATATVRHDRIRFPLTDGEGLTGRHAVQFWFRVERADAQALYECSVVEEGNPTRNRISLQIRDAKLVLEVLDEAGLDPEPSVVDTAVERSAGVWEVPIADIDLVPERWYHASLSAIGNAAGQLTLLIDNRPVGAPSLRTYLTAPIAAFQFNPNTPPDQQAAQLQLPIRVESTEGFPPRGVVKIGHELFEYTGIDGSQFQLQRRDSMGGRFERQRIGEFFDPVPVAGLLEDEAVREIMQNARTAIAPEHPIGSAVELYGYALPVYPSRFLEAASAQLTESIGAFAVARVVNRPNTGARPIEVQVATGATGGATINVTVGYGLDLNFVGDLELADPVSQAMPAAPASQNILSAFAEGGGYALLVQANRFPQGNGGTSIPVGGIEPIRYRARQGSKLVGIERGVTIQATGVSMLRNDSIDPGQPIRSFVTEWTLIRATPAGPGEAADFNEAPNWYTYVVPISLLVGGTVPAPSTTVEWAQILPTGDAIDTEWVRYNTVLDNRYLVRFEPLAYLGVLEALAGSTVVVGLDVQRGGQVNATNELLLQPWATPVDSRPNEIGYIDRIEMDFPGIHQARLRLGFRGDRRTGTSSHAHNSGDLVLPVHRFEFDWSRFGAVSPRPGRNDRIALAQGSARREGQVPGVEWHTVNWVYRHYESDPVSEEASGQRPAELEDYGPVPFTLVGLRDPVRTAYLGVADQSSVVLDDSRLLDRAVKFPSGELPAADVQSARIGESGHRDQPAMRGIVDEVSVVARTVQPKLLDSSFDALADSFFIRDRVTVTPLGPLHSAQPRQWANSISLPEEGGLLMIDGELIAYQSFDPTDQRVTVATDGRGLLGTVPRAHSAGTVVYFVDQVPTGILAGPLGARDARISMTRTNGFPRTGGTVLIGGRELAHYTWFEDQNVLAMPNWRDPAADSDDVQRQGLFRGRYGTDAISAPDGSPVLWWPFRYWDRYRPRSDDPESSYAQFSFEPGPAYFRDFGWIEEGRSSVVDLQCLVRIDGRGEFDGDPERTPGLFLLRDGTEGDGFVPIGEFGSRIEARFVVEYRPGAFDPENGRAHDWKFAPRVKLFGTSYEAETRILEERVTSR